MNTIRLTESDKRYLHRMLARNYRISMKKGEWRQRRDAKHRYDLPERAEGRPAR